MIYTGGITSLYNLLWSYKCIIMYILLVLYMTKENSFSNEKSWSLREL